MAAIHSPTGTTAEDPTIAWLLTQDPSIKWQVERDLLSLPPSVYEATRALIPTTGDGARLLSHQSPTTWLWANGAFADNSVPWSTWKEVGQPWTATCWSLQQLRDMGLHPDSDIAQRTVKLVGENGKWEHDGQAFWTGEVEECINGRTVAQGAYFGLIGKNVGVEGVVQRLLGEQQEDGGWNCERAEGSKRGSFHSTICVLEGLLEYETALLALGGDDAAKEYDIPSLEDVRAARRKGDEFLLSRGLYKRLSTGKPADEKFVMLLYPHRWRYDVLRALDYFRDAARLAASLSPGGPPLTPDPRLAEPVEHVRSKRLPSNGNIGNAAAWPLDWQLKGKVWFTADAWGTAPGEPSAWITLKALRVLKWWDESTAGAADHSGKSESHQ